MSHHDAIGLFAVIALATIGVVWAISYVGFYIVSALDNLTAAVAAFKGIAGQMKARAIDPVDADEAP